MPSELWWRFIRRRRRFDTRKGHSDKQDTHTHIHTHVCPLVRVCGVRVARGVACMACLHFLQHKLWAIVPPDFSKTQQLRPMEAPPHGTDVCTGLCLVLAPLFVGHFGLVRVVCAGKLRDQVENFGAGGNLLSYQHIRRRGYFNSMEISSISILVFSCKHKFSFQFLSL